MTVHRIQHYYKMKRVFDIMFSLLALAFSTPVFLFCAIIVRLTLKGTVFYRQKRVGHNGKLFHMLKLRTMREGVEDDTGPVWAGEDDPRATRFGRFLRKRHLDEMPQFINVLRGEMSIVGPRPERPFFVDKITESTNHYKKRLSVLPGITGLAQVQYVFEGSIDSVKEKLVYDLLYIEKMSLFLDILIILDTFLKVFLGKPIRLATKLVTKKVDSFKLRLGFTNKV